MLLYTLAEKCKCSFTLLLRALSLTPCLVWPYCVGTMKSRPTVSAMQALEQEIARLRFQIAMGPQPFMPRAWTGGNSPSLPSSESMPQSAYRRALFRQQVKTFRAYWGDWPNADTLRTFYRRARADAFATFRDARN